MTDLDTVLHYMDDVTLNRDNDTYVVAAKWLLWVMVFDAETGEVLEKYDNTGEEI